MSQSPLPKEESWKDLYVAALFEKDRSKLPQRIVEARTAITDHKGKLFASGNDTRERQVLDNALFSLGALKLCLYIATPSVQGSGD
jgi:hypothetical protein